MSANESFLSKHTLSIATIVAAVIGVAGLLVVEIYKENNKQLSLNNRDSETVMSESPDANGTLPKKHRENNGLSLRDVLDTLTDKGLSKLQLQNFIKQNKERIVTWKVVVYEVRPAYESVEDSDIYVIFHPLDEINVRIPEITLARFTHDKNSQLSSLSKGDVAIIEGKLNFNYLVSWSVSLHESKLLKFSKSR